MMFLKQLLGVVLILLALPALADDKNNPEVADVAIYFSNDIIGYLIPCG